MKQFKAEIRATRRLSSEFYLLEFAWDKDAEDPAPGQFFTVRPGDTTAPFLRRPFAFSGYDKKRGAAQAIYKRRGRATGRLSANSAGDTIDIIGPLGRPFPLPPDGAAALCAAGGIGLGPVLFLSRTLSEMGRPAVFAAGYRTRCDIADREIFAGLDAALCTDDGSEGYAGTVVDYISHYVNNMRQSMRPSLSIYACGPRAMLRACHEFAAHHGMECFVSVEQVMACGVGACMGCVVRAAGGGYLRVCTDGPVFNSKDLAWT